MTPRARAPRPQDRWFFRHDDDNTPQGKLARGCFYVIGWAVFLVVLIFLAQFAEHWFGWSSR